MILQQLYKDAEGILGHALPPPMYDTKPVRWVIALSADGTQWIFQSLGGDKANKKGLPHLVPYIGRTSGVRPILLADTPAYVLGIAPEDNRAGEKHASFEELVRQCLDATSDPLVLAVQAFLTVWDAAPGEIPADMGKSDLITFRINDKWPVDSPAVQNYWAAAARAGDDERTDIGQCLITGRLGPTEKSLPGMIKGVPGGQTSGVALVAANAVAFESFNLDRAQTSPICADAAEQFTKALNHLLQERSAHSRSGNLVYAFWTRDGVASDFISIFDRADPESVKDLLESHRTGRRRDTLVDNDAKFYGFALSASGARAVIRDWLDTTVGDARKRLAQWFEDHEITSSDGSETVWFSYTKLAAALYRDKYNDVPAQISQAIVRSALHDEPLPLYLLEKAVLRCRAERRVTARLAALMKAAWNRSRRFDTNKEITRPMTASLDPDNQNKAYACGRLLAELEAVQRTALGKINATLVDRYFGAASTTPATVFGILLTNANKAHLPKIRRQNEAVYHALQTRLAEIMAPLDGFPKTLTLANQAVFSLGYYHQRAADRKAAKEAAERKRLGKASQVDDALAELDDDIETR